MLHSHLTILRPPRTASVTSYPLGTVRPAGVHQQLSCCRLVRLPLDHQRARTAVVAGVGYAWRGEGLWGAATGRNRNMRRPLAWLSVACAASIPLAAAVSPLEVIDATGKPKSPESVMQYINRRVKVPADQSVLLVAAAGSKGSGKSTLLNKVFDTEFEVGRSLGPKPKGQGGLYVCTADGGNVLCFDYDGAATAAEESGNTGRFLTLTSRVADAVIFNIWSSDIGRKVPQNHQALQVIFQEHLNAEGSPRTLLVVAVHDHDVNGGDVKTRETITQELSAVWAGMAKGEDKTFADMSEYFDVEVVFLPHPRYRPSEYADAVQSLKARFTDPDFLSSRYSKQVTKEGLVQKLGLLWGDLRGRDVTILPSRLELLASYQIESHYSKALANIEAKLNAWKATVERGRVVVGFGAAAGKLYTSTLEEFDRVTQPLAFSPLRPKRHAELKEILTRGISDLVRRQLLNLQAQGLKRFKASLGKLVGSETREDDEVTAQRALEEWYTQSAEDVVVPAVQGAAAFEKAKTDFINQLTDFAHKWPSSPAYNVQAMKRIEKGAAKKRKQPGGKLAWGANFQLVGLLRLPGDGNLQGFATYAAGPVSFLFGCQNDRDLPESRVEGRAPPFIRLQPKVQFDVDL